MSSDISKLTPQELATLSSYPILPPPAGVQSNFANAKNRNMPFFVVDSVLLGVRGVFFQNRVYTKSFLIRKYAWDDCKSCRISAVGMRDTADLVASNSCIRGRKSEGILFDSAVQGSCR